MHKVPNSGIALERRAGEGRKGEEGKKGKG